MSLVRPFVRPVANRFRLALAAIAALAFLALPLEVAAATVTKKNNTTSLNKKQSWIGNRVPGSADIVLWDATVTSANTVSLGGNVSWLGLRITNPGGLVTINAGNTLTLGSSGIDMSSATVNLTLNCAVSLGSTQIWDITSGRTLLATGAISGLGGITKNGLGTVTLSGVNTFSGPVTINGGTLSVATASALGSGTSALTINPTGIFQATGTFSTTRTVTLGGTGGASSGGTFDVTGTNVETRTGVISGAGSLTKTGTGTLTLSAINSYAGDTYINGGTLSISNSQALGALPPSLGSSLYAVHMASGTTLQTTFTTTGDSRQLQLISGTATLDVTSAVSQQRNGLIYGSGGLIKTGAGTEILTNANTYSGGTTINGGVLQINNSSGSGTGTGAVIVNTGATLSGLPTATGFTTAGTISGAVTVNSGGILLARSGTTLTLGGLTLNASAVTNLQIGSFTSAPIINITGTNAFTFGGLSTINITNAGGLAAGTYQLFNYTGTALANITNLQLGSTPGGGFTYSLSNNQTNTSIDLIVSATNDQWANDANGNWGVNSNWTSGVFPNGVSAQANFLGVINQARTVTVNGAYTIGTMTFNNANSYTVATDAIAGHGLTLSNNGMATIGVLAGNHTISAPISLTDNFEITADASTALTISGAITQNSAGRTITLDGAGTVTLSGPSANTYTGLTTVSAGTLNLNKTAGVNAIGTGGIEVDSGATLTWLASNQISDTATVTANGTVALGTFSETIGALTGSGSVTVGSGSVLTIGASNNLSSTFAGTISGNGTIAKSGTGTFELTGANTFGGAGQTVTINSGTLSISSDGNLGNASNNLTFNGGTLLLSADVTSARSIVLAAAATFDTDNNAVTFNGTISGAGVLTKAGSGTLSLFGTNSYSGGTTINNGTVVVNNANGLGAASGTLSLNAGTLQVATGFTSARNVILGDASSTVAVDASQTYTASGIFSGTGSLKKTGTGTLTLTGANTFSGSTTVDAGTVILATTSGSALASTSGITVNAGGTLQLGNSEQINNSAGITLDGGTLAKGDFSEGTVNGVGIGALTLTATGSHIDFGTGSVGLLNFASFDPSVDQLTITIDNWTGTANTVGNSGTDRLIFNTSQSANLSLFEFTGYAPGATQFNLTGGFFEIVPIAPVPEPSTWFASALTLAITGFHQRRRLRRLFPWRSLKLPRVSR
jgi:fibronectin-binding autotransporter adhesin